MRTSVDAPGRSPGPHHLGGLVSRPARTAALPVRLAARAAHRLSSEPVDAGMTTAEYAVGTVAACGFGGILYKVITSPEILGLLRDVIASAFHLSF
jgi:hypothetical protein